jgi:DUF2892 family protein
VSRLVFFSESDCQESSSDFQRRYCAGKEIEKMGFVKFMVSPAGRIARIVAGVVLVALGLLVVKEAAGIILAVVGLIPLVAGMRDFCVFAPLFGYPFWGKDSRSKLQTSSK